MRLRSDAQLSLPTEAAQEADAEPLLGLLTLDIMMAITLAMVAARVKVSISLS